MKLALNGPCTEQWHDLILTPKCLQLEIFNGNLLLLLHHM